VLGLAVIYAIERGGEAVILAGGDRIELVIVATCAVHGEPEKSLRDGPGDFLQFIVSGRKFHGGVNALDGVVRSGDE